VFRASAYSVFRALSSEHRPTVLAKKASGMASSGAWQVQQIRVNYSRGVMGFVMIVRQKEIDNVPGSFRFKHL